MASSDPLAVFTRPPANETLAERDAREARESDAKRRSEAIDEDIRKEKARLKREEKHLVKVLLLGQSESGESFSYSLSLSLNPLSLQGSLRPLRVSSTHSSLRLP
jgi:hypothetical protein